MRDEYIEAQLQRILAEESAELGIDAFRRDDVIIVRGEVESEQRRQAVERRVTEHFPDLVVRNEITIIRVTKPAEAEQLAGQREGRH
jgi:hypothetical protein